MKTLYILLLSAFALLFSSCDEDKPVSPSAKQQIVGKITTISGEYLVNAVITAKRGDVTLSQDTTNDLGDYRLVNLPMSFANIDLYINHFSWQNHTISLEEIEKLGIKDNIVNLYLNGKDSCCGSLNLVLKSKETNQFITSAYVKLFLDDKPYRSVISGYEGKASFLGLCNGIYKILVRKEGFADIIETIEINSCTPKNFTFQLKQDGDNPKDSCCTNAFILNLKDFDNNSLIDNAKVRLYSNGKMIEYKYTSNGQVVFGELCEGDYAFDVLKDGYKSIEHTFSLSCPDTITWTKTLKKDSTKNCCEGKIKVWVRDSLSNKAISDVKVILSKGGSAIKDLRTNTDGYLYFDKLCEGEYNLVVYLKDGSTKTYNVNLACNEFKVVEAIAKAEENAKCNTASLKIRVKDKVNTIVLDNALVTVKTKDGTYKSASSNSDGYAFIEGIEAPAEYTIVISKAGYKTETITIKFKECKLIQETIMHIPE